MISNNKLFTFMFWAMALIEFIKLYYQVHVINVSDRPKTN